MDTYSFVDFIKYGKYSSIADLFSYAKSNNLVDILNYYCKKYKIKFPIIYQRAYDNTKFLSMNRFEKLKKFLKTLNDNKINYYIIKGPSISKYLYDDLFERLYSDIDIIVSACDYIKLHKCLTKNGFHNAYINNSIPRRSILQFSFNIRGEDIIYSKNVNNFEIGFEIRDTIRLLNLKQMDNFNKHIERCTYGGFDFNQLDLHYTIVLQIIYAYNAYFTEYGVVNNYKIKYIIELYMLLNKYSFIQMNEIKHIFSNLKLNYMYNSIIKVYNLLFIDSTVSKRKIAFDIYRKFDDANYRLSNYYISLFKSKNKEFVNESFHLSTFDNEGRFKQKIVRPFTVKNSQNSLKFSYDIFYEEKCYTFFVSFPRLLDDVTFQIILINNKNYQHEVELTFYKDFINEYRSTLPINYFFNYLDSNKKCYIFKIAKEIFESNVSDTEFLFKIMMRKIWIGKYPLMSFEHENYKKFFIDYAKRMK